DIVEIRAGIVGCRLEVTGCDHVVDDVSDVGRGADAPVAQHGRRHQTVLAQGQSPDGLAQLPAGHVARWAGPPRPGLSWAGPATRLRRAGRAAVGRFQFLETRV